jgi:hypothetical protein
LESVRLKISRRQPNRELAQVASCLLLKVVSALLEQGRALLSREFEALHYIGPLRAYPPRQLTIGNRTQSDESGGSGWETIARSSETLHRINVWLGDEEKMATPFRLSAPTFVRTDLMMRLCMESLGSNRKLPANSKSWAALMETVNRKAENAFEDRTDLAVVRNLLLVDQRNNTPVSHRDVGLGVSQLLPVLAAAFGGNRRDVRH